MGPKRAKTPKPAKEKGSGAGANKKTDLAVTEIPINEKGKWTACIALLVGSQVDDDWFISGIGCSVATECRQLFQFLSAPDIYKIVRELGEGGSTTPRAKSGAKGSNKDKENPGSNTEASPEIHEACAACLPYVRAGKEPPLPLLAKIIKFKLLDIKNKDMQRRELTNPSVSAAVDNKGKKAAKGKSKPGKEDEASQGKTSRAKEKEEKKPEKTTDLATREEMEAVEKLVINDEPVDGADQYILLTGFTNPHLLTFLADARVEINCIIKVRASNYEVLREIVALCPPQFCGAEVESATTTREDAETNKDNNTVNVEIVEPENDSSLAEACPDEIRRRAVQKFWCDISAILDSVPEDSVLHNVARLEYLVPDTITYLQLCDPNSTNEFFLELYNSVACLMYNVTMMMRHWQTYLSCLRLIHLPAVPTCLLPTCHVTSTAANREPPLQASLQSSQPLAQQPPAQPASNGTISENGVQRDTVTGEEPGCEEAVLVEVPSVDMSYYTRLMDTLPVECSSVPLMMHCMLEQICYNEREENDQLKQEVEPDGAAAPLAGAGAAAPVTAAAATAAADAQATDSDTRLSNSSAQEECLDHNLAVRLAELEAKLGLPSLANPEPCCDDYSVSDAKLTRARCVAFGQPELVSESDDISHRLDSGAANSNTSLSCAFSPKRAELEMLYRCGRIATALMSARELRECSQESEELEKEARLQQLLSYCSSSKSLSPSEVTHALQQFILECIDLAKVDACELNRIHAVPRRDCPSIQVDIPWDDPFPYYKSMRVEDGEECGDEFDCTGRNNSNNKRSRSAKSQKSDDDDAKATPDPAETEASAVQGEGVTAECGECQGIDECPIDIEVPVSERVPAESFQKRCLNEFSYAEHFQSGVVLQVIADALYTHPYVECYRCRRDGNLFVVLDAPHGEVSQQTCGTGDEDQGSSTTHTGAVLPFQAYSDWHAELHSNVGFRYFLEYVSGGLSDWIQIEEGRRLAALMAAEVERLNREQASSRGLTESERATSSADGLVNECDVNADYIRAGSLKAWKAEQEQRKKEEEEHASKVMDSDGKKSKEGKETPKGKDKKGKNSEGSKSPKSSSPSRKGTPKSGKMSPPPAASAQPGDDKQTVMVEVEDDASFYPFVGYDTRHRFIHVGGVTRTVYPPNCCSNEKSLIRTERVVFRHGEHFVKGTVCVDGHILNIHILEPKIPDPCAVYSSDEHGDCGEQCMSEQCKDSGVGLFGSLTGVLKDGISLALSHHGPSGKPPNENRYVPEPYVLPTPPPVSPSAAETVSEGKKAGGKKDKDSSRAASVKSKKSGSDKEKVLSASPQQQQQLQPEPTADVVTEQTEQNESKEKEGEQKEPEKQSVTEPEPFQQLFVSCPNGLSVKYCRSDCRDDVDDSCGLKMAERGGCDVSSGGLSDMFVRQSYLDRRSASVSQAMARGPCGTQAVKSEEWSRVVTWDGTVVKTMSDGTVEILYADGSMKEFVYESPLVRLLPCPVVTPATSRTSEGREEAGEEAEADATVAPSPERKDSNHNGNASNEKSSKKKSQQIKSTSVSDGRTSTAAATNENQAAGDAQGADQSVAAVEGSEEAPPCVGIWISTSPSGERTVVDTCGRLYEAMDAMIYTASDPMTREVIHTREDHVLTVFRCDDSVVVEHHDGTRITTRYVEVCAPCSEDTETGEALEGVLKHFRVVAVESPGYATVTFDETTRLCRTLFGTGTVIDARPDGSYTVLPLGGHGCLQIGSDGRANYTQRCPDGAGNRPVYSLSHVDNSLIEYSTIVQCQPSGQENAGTETEIGNPMGMKSTVSCAIDETVSMSLMSWPVSHEDVEIRDTGAGLGLYLRTPGTALWDGCAQLGADLTAIHRQQYESCREAEPKCYNPCGPAPRLFVINPCDLTGLELLRWSDLREYFSEVDSDPSALILKDELMDCPGVTGISVMKPQPPGPSARWILPYREASIMPAGLRSRDLRSIPAKEVKRPGPMFGATAGRGLCIGPECSCGCCYNPTNRSCEVPPVPPCRSCPPSLDYRMFLAYRPVSEDMRSRICQGLKCYADHVLDQEDLAAACNVESPATREQGSARDRPHSQNSPDVPNCEQTPPSCAPLQPNQTKNLARVYEEKCNAALNVPPPPAVKQLSQSGKFDRQRAERERAEDEELRRALRECKISPYFLSDVAPSCMRAGAQQTVKCAECEGGTEIDQSNTCSSNVHVIPSSAPQDGVVETGKSAEQTSDGETVGAHMEAAATATTATTAADVTVDSRNNSNDTAVFDGGSDNSETPQTELEKRLLDSPVSPNTVSNDQEGGADFNVDQTQASQGGISTGACCPHHLHVPSQELPADVGQCNSNNVEGNPVETTRGMIASLTDDIVYNAVTLADSRYESGEQEQVQEGEGPQHTFCVSDPEHSTDVHAPAETLEEDNNNECNGNFSQEGADEEYNGSQEAEEAASGDGGEVCGTCSRAVPYCNCYPQYICPPRPLLHKHETYTSIAALQHRNVDGHRTVARDRQRPSHEIGRLVVIPQRADFGVLKEGCTYSLATSLKNLGYDPCRFRVKQPPPSTGIRVIYTPGPILAGLKTQLQIQLFAIAVGVEGEGKGCVGLICHNLEILTETGTLYLPITANVLTETEYECRSAGSPRGGKAVGVRVLNGQAPAACVGVRLLKRD